MTALAAIISDHLAEVRGLCVKHHVRQLELFGSAANARFDAGASDLDFLVEFEPLVPSDRADAYFGLLAALQDLFLREVDLVETEAIDNPYFRKVIDQQRMVLYAA